MRWTFALVYGRRRSDGLTWICVSPGRDCSRLACFDLADNPFEAFRPAPPPFQDLIPCIPCLRWENGWAALPVTLGFISGGALLQLTDMAMHQVSATCRHSSSTMPSSRQATSWNMQRVDHQCRSACTQSFLQCTRRLLVQPSIHNLLHQMHSALEDLSLYKSVATAEPDATRSQRLRRLLLLIIAITIHNFPGSCIPGFYVASRSMRDVLQSPYSTHPVLTLCSPRQRVWLSALPLALSGLRPAPLSAKQFLLLLASGSKISPREWQSQCPSCARGSHHCRQAS